MPDRFSENPGTSKNKEQQLKEYVDIYCEANNTAPTGDDYHRAEYVVNYVLDETGDYQAADKLFEALINDEKSLKVIADEANIQHKTIPNAESRGLTKLDPKKAKDLLSALRKDLKELAQLQ